MKITITTDDGKVLEYTLPQNKDGGEDISIIHGRQPIILRKNGEWFGKTSWCNHCGLCCIQKHPDYWLFKIKMLKFGDKEIPFCEHARELVDGKIMCSAGIQTPLNCILAYSPTEKVIPFCSVKFEALKEKKP